MALADHVFERRRVSEEVMLEALLQLVRDPSWRDQVVLEQCQVPPIRSWRVTFNCAKHGYLERELHGYSSRHVLEDAHEQRCLAVDRDWGQIWDPIQRVMRCHYQARPDSMIETTSGWDDVWEPS